MRATSVGTASARAPDFAAIAPTARAAASSAAPGRSARQRLRPRAAKLLAAARPMPLAAPVMTALRPAARAGWSVMAGLLFCHQRFLSPKKRFLSPKNGGAGQRFQILGSPGFLIRRFEGARF